MLATSASAASRQVAVGVADGPEVVYIEHRHRGRAAGTLGAGKLRGYSERTLVPPVRAPSSLPPRPTFSAGVTLLAAADVPGLPPREVVRWYRCESRPGTMS